MGCNRSDSTSAKLICITIQPPGHSSDCIVPHDGLAHFFAGLEVGDMTRGQRYFLARLWIPGQSWRFIFEAKTSEAANLDPPPLRQGHGKRFEDLFNRDIRILQGEQRKAFGELGNQF